MKQKEPYYHLKKWEKIINIQCTVFVACVILILLLIMIGAGINNMTLWEIIANIGISIVTGIITSISLSIFIYYKYLKRIPEENQKKIEDLLDRRLSYETSNHNAIIQANTPNNRDVQHQLSKEHNDLKQNLEYLCKKAIEEDGRRTMMNTSQIDLDNYNKQISFILSRNIDLENELINYKRENTYLKQQLKIKTHSNSFNNDLNDEYER